MRKEGRERDYKKILRKEVSVYVCKRERERERAGEIGRIGNRDAEKRRNC